MKHKTIMSGARAGVLALGLILAAGCEQPRWDDPAYISQQLEQGDPNMRTVALGHFETLPDDKKKAVVPALTKVYLEKGPNQKEIINQLVMLRDPAAKDAYIEEVKSNAGGKAGAAAEALGEAKARDAIPAMLELLKSTDDNEAKQGILRGLSHMPDPQMVPALTELLGLNPDNYPIAFHAYSCEILGNIAEDKPEALDDKARAAVVKGIFLANNKRQDVSFECGLAAQQLGAPAIPLLIQVWKGENKDVQRLMMAYNFPSNRPKGVATTRLTSMRAAQAAPMFLEDLTIKEFALPDAVKNNANAKAAYLQMVAQTLSEEMLGLGDMAYGEAKDALIAVMSGEMNEPWKDFMLDPAVQTQLRQDAAQALNRIGDREAAPKLFEMVRKLDANAELEKMAAYFEKKGQPMSPIERYSFNIVTAQAYANLATGQDKAAYKAFVDGLKDAKLKAELAKNLPAFDTHAECSAKGDAKAQAACYDAKLADANAVVRTKAAYELSRLPSAAAAPVLNKHIESKHMALRELIAFGLYRHPNKDAIAGVDAVIEKDKDRSGAAYKLNQRRYKLLSAWLKNNT